MGKKRSTSMSGITSKGNVIIRDIHGQVGIGENIQQTQTLSLDDKKQLIDNLTEFKTKTQELSLSKEKQDTVNEQIDSVLKETKKENPKPSEIKKNFEKTLQTIKEHSKESIVKVTKWEQTKKIMKFLGQIGISIARKYLGV